MFHKIKITPTALLDLQDAIVYYNKQQQELGRRFKEEVQTLFTQLSKVPASGSFMYDTVRFRVLNKFPFIILYEIHPPKSIVILRIFNTYQNPFWQ